MITRKELEEIARLKGLSLGNTEKDYLLDIDKKTITLLDSNSTFKIEYTLQEKPNYTWAAYLIVFIIVILIILVYLKSKRKKERLKNIMPLINENEQKIISILMKKPMRQKEIRNTLNIPKASFSRYLINLEKKKLIMREGDGKNKIIKLK